jgi:CPA1 family monovalent cation:H+ antiporter
MASAYDAWETGRVHLALTLIVLLTVVIAIGGVSLYYDLPAPLILTVIGAVASFVPGVPTVELTPDLVLIGLLPPLLYAAAIRTSLVDFRHNLRPIGLLSVGLVVFTTLGVGLVTWWVIPGLPLAAGFALGAVVAPPDAVAATAVARRVGLPRRVITILEGESLVNDATALVALRLAVAAIGSTITAWEIVADFAMATVGGVGVGIVVAAVVGNVRKHVRDPLTDTSLSLVTPFAAYLAAEQIHASGVLALVVTGLLLGHVAPRVQSASSRTIEQTNWTTIAYVLENTVFLLIGLQTATIVNDLGDSTLTPDQVTAATAAVVLAVVLLRPIWVFPATYLTRLVPSIARRDPAPPWTYPAVISWAGMRGVVTLAAVFVLPADTPHREVLVLIALVVVGATLLLQGATLPWVVRRLRLSGPDPAQDALHEAETYQRATIAGLKRLEELDITDVPEEVVDRLKQRAKDRVNAAWEQLGSDEETPAQAYARLRTEMLQAERDEVLEVRGEGLAPHEVLQRVLYELDIEETTVERIKGVDRSGQQQDVRGGPRDCEHLLAVEELPQPRTPDGCEECLRDGTRWVHLRLCMQCGHVGCCDSSVHKHASAHFRETSHPVIRSFERGEAWRWCFVDRLVG